MNSVSAVNFEGAKQPQTKSKKRYYANKGIIRASYAQGLAASSGGILSLGIMKAMKKISNLNPEDTVQLRKATQKGLKDTGLYKKGVRAYHMKDVPMPKTKEMLGKLAENMQNMENNIDELGKNPMKILDSFFPVKYSRKDRKALEAIKTEINAATGKTFDRIEKSISRMSGGEELANTFGDISSIKEMVNNIGSKTAGLVFKTGKNACYLPNANKIITPEKALQTSVFHEMGHALNNNGGIVMKALQKARPAAKFIPALVLTTALLNKRKTTDEKSDNKVQNFFDGVKKNAGKLTFLGMLPMIAEETIASLRGGMVAEKLAKSGNLSKTLLNKIRLTNACSFTSYMTAGLVAAGATALAVKLKDGIQEKYENKKNAKYDARDARIEAKKQAKEAKKANKPE